MNGIIASIQKYSPITTQELAETAVKNGIIGIRTDQPIKVNCPVIGLKKIVDKKYYITTDKDIIFEIARWANYVAIDSRKGNRELDWLYAHAHTGCIDIVADIEKIADVEHILNMCKKLKIRKPKYFATTFSDCNIKLISEIRKITEIPVIAEGGYSTIQQLEEAKRNGANAVCMGASLDMSSLSKKFATIWGALC